MFQFSIEPIFADIGTVVTVLVMVIAFISWLMNQIGGGAHVPKPNAEVGRRRPPRPDNLQEEIARFRRELKGKAEGAGVEAVDAPPARRRPEVSSSETPIRSTPSGSVTPRPAKVVRREARQPARTPVSRPATPRTVLPETPNKPLKEHLAEVAAAGRVGALTEWHLGSRASKEASVELGQVGINFGSSQASEELENKTSVGEIVAMLRNPANIRRAILVNEILSRPKALRR